MPALKTTIRGLGNGAKSKLPWRLSLVESIRRLKTHDEANKLRAKTNSGKLVRVGAYHMMRACDNGLRLCGSGCDKFKKNNLCRPLTSSEEHYTRPSKRPYPFEVPAHVSTKRLCVFDNVSKKTRYELRWGEISSYPLITCVADEGPKDAPAWQYLTYVLRWLSFIDPLHRTPRDLHLAAERSGNWQMILDTTAVFNYDHAPYLSSENFRKAVEAVTIFAQNAGIDDELLLTDFEGLCEAMGDMPLDFGSPDHVKRIVESLPFAQAFTRKAQKTKWSRWGSHQDSAQEFLPNIPCKRFVVRVSEFLSHGIVAEKSSTPSSAASTSGTSSSSSSHLALPSSAPTPMTAAVSTTRRTHAQTKGVSSTASTSVGSTSTLDDDKVAAAGDKPKKFTKPIGVVEILKVLDHEPTWSRCYIWNAFTDVIWKAAKAEYQGFRQGETKCLQYAYAYSHGAYFKKIKSMFASLSSLAVLQKARLELLADDGVPRSLTAARKESLFLEQKQLSDIAFDVVFECMRFRSLSQLHYTDCLPGRFGGLVPGGDHKPALAYCKLAYECMCKFEVDRHVFKECKDLWQNVPFLQNEPIRETLKMLAEFNFEWIPPHVTAHVRTMFSWMSSLVTELGNRELRMRLLESHGVAVAPQTLWKALADGSVMKDFNRPEPVRNSGVALPVLSRSAYSSISGSSTLAADASYAGTLEKIMDAPKDRWKPMDSLSKHLVPSAWGLMMQVTQNPEMRGRLPRAWHAVLAMRKDVVQKIGSPETYLVYETSKFGFMGWLCKVSKVPGEQTGRLVLTEDAPSWRPIFEPSEWKSFQLRNVPPIWEVWNGRQPAICVVIDTPSVPLLARAADCAFNGVPSCYIDKLLKEHVLRKDASISRPGLLLQRIILLMVKFCPHLTHEQILARIRKRREHPGTAPIVSADGELAEAFIDNNEKKELRECSKEHSNKQEQFKTGLKEDTLVGSKFLEELGFKSSVASRTVPGSVPRKAAVGLAVDWKKAADYKHSKQFKPLLPHVVECFIKVTPLKRCFTAYYPDCFPASRTRTWGHLFSKQAVLKHCVKWAWQRHTDRTGEKRPFAV